MLICEGDNVYGADVEQVLLSQPSVEQVAIIGTNEHSADGVTAGVAPRSGAGLTHAALVGFGVGRSAGSTPPGRLVLVDELLRNGFARVVTAPFGQLPIAGLG